MLWFFLAVGILAQVAAVALAGRFDNPRVAPEVVLPYAVAVAGDLCIVAAGLVVAAAPERRPRGVAVIVYGVGPGADEQRT